MTTRVLSMRESAMFAARRLFASLLAAAALAPSLARADTPAPAGASVYFINIKDGDTVTSPFKVQFGLIGMGIAPAGVERPNTGHHHLLVDTTLSPDELTQ